MTEHTEAAVPESPQVVHGRLLDAVHISGYSFARAARHLEHLLDEDRWKQCGGGFEDIRDFLATVDLSPFNIEASRRKKLAKRLKELNASQRATAKALGVDKETVRRDLTDGANAPPDETEAEKTSPSEEKSGANAPPKPDSGVDAARLVEKKSRDAKRTAEKKAKREEKAQRERSASATVPTLLECRIEQLFSRVDGASVDVVITDPPYPHEFLPLYSDLADFCGYVLKPGGLLVCMAGQSYLPEIITRLSQKLRYLWCCSYLTPGGQAVQLWDRQVNTFWKPLLVFSNGNFEQERWIGDVFKSDVNDNDKDHHHWGQSESGMSRIVAAFSEPGELVCDPFLGGGTTAVVACEMGREFIGADSSAECVATARRRCGLTTE